MSEEEEVVTWRMLISHNKMEFVLVVSLALLLLIFLWTALDYNMKIWRNERLAACSAYSPETALPLNVPASEKKGDCVYVPLVEADCDRYDPETGSPLNEEASVEVGDCVYD